MVSPRIPHVRSNRELEALLVGLLQLNVDQMRDGVAGAGERIPPLYGGTIRYAREPGGQEDWKTARDVAAHGYGDCEDLATYRAAEYWVRGIKAMPHVLTITPRLRHVVVRLPDGKIEDPSKKLGMGGKG